MKDPTVIAALVPAAGTVAGALWYALTKPENAKASELARGLYWCSLLWLVFDLAKAVVAL